LPKLTFTDTVIRALPSPERGQREYFDTAFKGGVFALRVSRASKTFLIWHRNRRITLGRYPILGLADARTEARRVLAEFTLGKLKPKALTYPAARQMFLDEKTTRSA
jgi:Arm DNA-binding domain